MKLNRLSKSVLGLVSCGLTLALMAPTQSFAASKPAKPDWSAQPVNTGGDAKQAMPQPKQSQTPINVQPKVTPKPGSKTNFPTNVVTANHGTNVVTANHGTNVVTANHGTNVVTANHGNNFVTNRVNNRANCYTSLSSYLPYCYSNYCSPCYNYGCGNYCYGNYCSPNCR